MSATVTAPGYWLVKSSRGNGIVYYPSAGTLKGATGAEYLGARAISVANLRKAIGDLNLPGLFEISGGLGSAITRAEKNGATLYGTQTPSNAVPDPIGTAAIAAILAAPVGLAVTTIGGVIAGGTTAAEAGAAAGGGTAAAEGAAAGGAGTAAAESAGGGAAGSGLASNLTSALKTAAGAASIATLLTDPRFLFRALKFIGGLLLAFLGLRQLAAAGGANVGGPGSALTVGA